MAENGNHAAAAKAYSVPVAVMLVSALVLFVPAGSLRFWQGWLWWSVIAAMTLAITVYFLRRDPELLARRRNFGERERQPRAARILSAVSLLLYVLPGLDYRFQWSAVPVWVVIAANAGVFAGYAVIFQVLKANRYASTIIQVESAQTVITTGPYALVRHPLYTGLGLMQVFTPLALGSYWALLLPLLFIPRLVLRIRTEEEVLRRDLPGYDDYLRKTRYRLFPFVW